MGKFDKLDKYTQEKFIETLRLFPCLWDEQLEACKYPKKREHKAQRKNALTALLIVLRNNYSYRNATVETVKDLLNSLMSSFKTQRNKVIIDQMCRTKDWYHKVADFVLYRSERRSSLTPTQIHGDAAQFLQVNLQEYPVNSHQVDYGCPTNLIENRRNDGIPSCSPHLGPSASHNIFPVTDTSSDTDGSSPEPKRRKHGSSSSTRTSSIEEDFANYVKVMLSNMGEDQRMKATGKITEILLQGRNGRL